MSQSLYSMSFNCHLLLMSSSITNGWTLGRAIIEENSRHYNSLVCPLAALSSCFISTNFLLLLHDVMWRSLDTGFNFKRRRLAPVAAQSGRIWSLEWASSNWILSIPRTLFFLFLSFFPSFLETNWIKQTALYLLASAGQGQSLSCGHWAKPHFEKSFEVHHSPTKF